MCSLVFFFEFSWTRLLARFTQPFRRATVHAKCFDFASGEAKRKGNNASGKKIHPVASAYVLVIISPGGRERTVEVILSARESQVDQHSRQLAPFDVLRAKSDSLQELEASSVAIDELGRTLLDDPPLTRARTWDSDVDPSTPPITVIVIFARRLLVSLPSWLSLAKSSTSELGIHVSAQGVLLQLDVTCTQSFSTCRDRCDGTGRRNLVGRSDRSNTANIGSQDRGNRREQQDSSPLGSRCCA